MLANLVVTQPSPASARDDGNYRGEIFREAKRCFGAVSAEDDPREFLPDRVAPGGFICLAPWKNMLNAAVILF